MGYIGGTTETAHGVHLVFHQRDKRRHNDSRTGQYQGRQLIAQRFSSPRRHNHKSVLSCQDILNNGLLITLETGKTEYAQQFLMQKLTATLHGDSG